MRLSPALDRFGQDDQALMSRYLPLAKRVHLVGCYRHRSFVVLAASNECRPQSSGRSFDYVHADGRELRRIAERAPEVADELRYVAIQLEADAGELERHISDGQGGL